MLYSKQNKKGKTVLKWVGIVLGVIVGIVLVFFIFSAITQYRPDTVTKIEYTEAAKVVNKDKLLSIVTLNTGYAGLDATQDFFMDGGKGVNPQSKEQVENNIAQLNRILELLPSDFYFLQEVDKESSRTYRIDQTEKYLPEVTTRIFAQNHNSKWIPYPLPMIGKVNSGLLTLTNYKVTSAERISIPDTTSWPKSMFFFKRCFTVSRLPIEDSEKELILINTHLEAYTDDATRTAQFGAIFEIMEREYAAGNYVLVGGDFNTSFPKTQNKYPINPDLWTPSQFTKKELPAGFKFAYDNSSPTCRLLNKPYDDPDSAQYYCIDGFIVSKNINVENVMTLNFGFANTDHNPVMMYFKLKDKSASTEGNSEE